MPSVGRHRAESGVDRRTGGWGARGLGRSVEDFGADYVAVGPSSAGEVMAEIDAWREAAGTHFSVLTMGLGLDSVDGHVDYLASVADALNLS